MALKHAILVSLGDTPMSGYDLAKHFDESIGFFWRATHPQIYRELAKLKDKGLVSAEEMQQQGRPKRTVYSLTDAGRQEILAWSRQPSTPDSVKDDFLVRLYGLDHVDIPALREDLQLRMEGHRDRCERFSVIAAGIEPRNITELGRLRGLEIGLRYEREWAAWCEETLEALKDEHLVSLEDPVVKIVGQ
ncbi:MAG: PadR family transcriptional regulator [Pseudomonadota bacterium]